MSFEAELAISNSVADRNEFGQFRSLLERARVDTLEELAEDGMTKAIEYAPKSARQDPRTPHIRDSMFTHVGLNTARWGSSARHALPQETGSRRHRQTGQVRFWWEKAGRWWVPGDNEINHPGNPPTHFLRKSYDWVMANALRVLDKHYPG